MLWWWLLCLTYQPSDLVRNWFWCSGGGCYVLWHACRQRRKMILQTPQVFPKSFLRGWPATHFFMAAAHGLKWRSSLVMGERGGKSVTCHCAYIGAGTSNGRSEGVLFDALTHGKPLAAQVAKSSSRKLLTSNTAREICVKLNTTWEIVLKLNTTWEIELAPKNNEDEINNTPQPSNTWVLLSRLKVLFRLSVSSTRYFSEKKSI